MRTQRIKRGMSLILTMLILLCCTITNAEAPHEVEYIYVRVDSPTSGQTYVMASLQGDAYYAVSNTPMPDGEGLWPSPCTVAGDYLVSPVEDSILWEFEGDASAGFTVRSVADQSYLGKFNYSLGLHSTTQQRWEYVIHANEDDNIGEEPVMHNITAGGYILYRTHQGVSYFDCFNAYQQCNIVLFERRVLDESFVPVTGVLIGAESLDMSLGESFQFEASVLPENATIQTVTYTSSNEDVARVTKDGMLITGDEGETIITAFDGTGEFFDSCTVTVRSVVSGAPDIRAYRIYSGENGIVTFSAQDPENIQTTDSQTDLPQLSAMCRVEDVYYGFVGGSGEHNLVIIDGDDFVRTETNLYSGYYVRDMTYDPVSGLIYCLMATNATIYSLYYGIYTVDPVTLSFQLVGETNRYLSVLECTTDGRLYGIDMYGYLCDVSKQDASCQEIARTSVTYLNHEQSMCFSPDNGRMYWMQADDEGGAFYEVNLATARLTLMGYPYPGGDSLNYVSLVGLCALPMQALLPSPTPDPAFTPEPTETIVPTAEPTILGDANGDGTLNVGDAVCVLRYCIGLIGAGSIDLDAADANADGAVNTGDAAMILMLIP